MKPTSVEDDPIVLGTAPFFLVKLFPQIKSYTFCSQGHIYVLPIQYLILLLPY